MDVLNGESLVLRNDLLWRLAAHLLAQGVLNLAQASRVAHVCIEDFLSVLRDAGVDAVDYPPEELDAEMEVEI